MSRFYQQQKLAFADIKKMLKKAAEDGTDVPITALTVEALCNYEVSRRSLRLFIEDCATSMGFCIVDDELIYRGVEK